MRHYKKTICNKSVHITEWGNQSSPIIFCLHGLGSTSLSFIEIAETLQTEYRIIAVDAPGHGKSEAFDHAEDYQMTSLVSWMHQLLNSLNISSFYLLSHSWGSNIALFYTAQYPNQVKGNILIDGGYYLKAYLDKTAEEEAAFYEKDFDDYSYPTHEAYIKDAKLGYKRWNDYILHAVNDLVIEKDNTIRWHAKGSTARHIIMAMHQDEPTHIYHKLPKNIRLFVARLPKHYNAYRDTCLTVFKEQVPKPCIEYVPDSTHLLHWDYPTIITDAILNHWHDSN